MVCSVGASRQQQVSLRSSDECLIVDYVESISAISPTFNQWVSRAGRLQDGKTDFVYPWGKGLVLLTVECFSRFQPVRCLGMFVDNGVPSLLAR